MPTNGIQDWYDDASAVAIVLMVAVVALILYGTIVLREILAVVGLVAPVIALYLLWRGVLAAERAADAAEAIAADRPEEG